MKRTDGIHKRTNGNLLVHFDQIVGWEEQAGHSLVGEPHQNVPWSCSWWGSLHRPTLLFPARPKLQCVGCNLHFAHELRGTRVAVYDKQALMALVREKALKFGQFTLCFGQTGQLLPRRQAGDARFGRVAADRRRHSGTALGQRPCRRPSAACRSAPIRSPPPWSPCRTSAARRCVGFMVRKESKGHGTNQYIEGPVRPAIRSRSWKTS